MPRLPVAAAFLLLLLVTLPARAAEPMPEADAPPPAEPSVVVEPPPTTEPAALPTPPTLVTTSAPQPAKAAAVAAAPAAITAPALKRDRHGLALSLGLGITFSFFGGQARYDIPVRPSLTVSPFVGAGFFGLLTGPVGVSTALGARHRLVGDVALAPLGRNVLFLHDTRVEGPMVYGPMAAIGYEHMSDSGWFQRATIEYAHAVWGSTLRIREPSVIFSAISFGWRIW